MIGKTVSHYRILDELGRGGMGVVYRAEDTKLRRTVALKFLPPGLTRDDEAKARFIREAQSASSLQHNNICTIHEIGETEDGSLFIVMDFYEGETLRERIARGPLPADEAVGIAMQVAAGLSKAKGAGMVHRDIKPANIMISADGVVKILDFGLAKLLGRTKITRTGSTPGTAAYLSPEQAKGMDADHRTDTWALGALMYEMLAGVPPFKGEHEAALLYGIVHEEPRPLDDVRPDVPEELRRIVARALTKDIDERYQSADGLLADLKSLGQDHGAGRASAGASRSVAGRSVDGRSKTGRNIFIAVTAAAVALAAVIIGQRYIWHRGAPQQAERKMIAVLPFENLGDAEDEYFAEGMTEEITSRLSMVRGLGVISRTSARRYAGTDKDIGEIGAELGVGYILEGTVRWSRTGSGKGRVRITPQLIRVSDDTHMWAEPYDRVIDDIFAVQSDIARDVAEVLDITLMEHEREGISTPPTRNLEAYHAYLRGRYFATRPHFTVENWNSMMESYTRAVSLDPGFALVHAELARAHAALCYYQEDLSKERRDMARRAAERALELAPTTPQVHVSLASYHLYLDRDTKAAMEEVSLAEERLHDNADLLRVKGHIYEVEGRFDDALRAFERAFELSPRDADIQVALALDNWLMRRYPQADEAAKKAIVLAPEAFWPYLTVALVDMSWQGGSDAGRNAIEAVPRERAWSIYLRYYIEMMFGNYRKAIECLAFSSDEWIRIKTCARPKAFFAAAAYELLGETEQSRSLYEKAREMLEAEVAIWPEDPRLHSTLGIVYAVLGQAEEAIREGKRAVEILPVSKDAFYGLPYEQDLSVIYTITGERDKALAQIERLLTIPSWISPAWLRSDPSWNLLRGNPRFEQILDEHSDGAS